MLRCNVEGADSNQRIACGVGRRAEQHHAEPRCGDSHTFSLGITKVHHRLLRPLLAADHPPAPPKLRKALLTKDTHGTQYIGVA